MRNGRAIWIGVGSGLTVLALAACSQGSNTGAGGNVGVAGGPVVAAGMGGSAVPLAGTGGPPPQAGIGAAGTAPTLGTAGTGASGQGSVAAQAGTGAAGAGASGAAAGNGAAGGAGTTPPSAPCTGRTGMPGTSSRMVMSGALQRTFKLHIPSNLDPNVPAPVLLVHHGFTMTGQIMEDITGFDAVADSEGFIAIYPDGGGAAPWNVGQNICGVGAAVAGVEDDFAFIDKMLADVEAAQCIDRTHVFLTGFSMGGYFSNHAGCQLGNTKLRAVAPHSGGTYPGDCPGAPLPIMIVHGTGDALITPDCGMGARDLWVQRNGCSTEVEVRPVKGGNCEWHKDCPAGGQVVLCMLDGMAHGWAGASSTDANGFYGGGSEYESATRLIWDFFKAQF